MTNLQTLKKCTLENPSLLFGPIAQYLGSDKRRVLSPCVTFAVGDNTVNTVRLDIKFN